MTQQREQHLYSVGDYLELERVSELKHEYISGEIAVMAGATRAHNLVTGNAARRLGNPPRPLRSVEKDSQPESG